MKLLALLSISLSAVYGTKLAYEKHITSFDFNWKNEGSDAARKSFDFSAISGGAKFLTNDKYTSIDGDEITPIPGTSWSKNDVTGAAGMNGEFKAVKLKVDSTCTHWKITSAKIYFDDGTSEQCMNDNALGQYSYADTSGTTVIKDATISPQPGPEDTFYFQADIPTAGIETNGPFTFNIRANKACEGNIEVREYELKGECVAKTASPTTKPPTTPHPTTPAPTPARPQCLGAFAFGDPHYLLFAGAGSRHHKNDPNYSKQLRKFDFQGRSDEGWYYYYFPCTFNDYGDWPFFLMSQHKSWKGRKASIINDNRLILNTKDKAWVLEYTDKRLKVNVGNGAEPSSDFHEKSSISYSQGQLKKFEENDPLKIKYDDLQGQSGELRIWFDSANKIVIEIHDLSYSQDCDGKVMEIRHHGSWLTYTCPECMYGEACGVMGKYIRGDCTADDFDDPQHECHNVLVGSDGKIYNAANTNRQGKKLDNYQFTRMAETWAKDTVEDKITGTVAGSYVSALKNRDFQDMAPLREGRAADVDFGVFEGDCEGNPGRVLELNVTCNEHTWGKYKGCCDKIGYCDLLWNACVIDMCFCPKDEEEDCLHGLIHQTLNDTCSYKPLFPQATRDPALDEPVLSRLGTVPTVLICIAVAIPVLILLYSVCKWFVGKREERREELEIENENLQQDGTGATGYDMSPINTQI